MQAPTFPSAAPQPRNPLHGPRLQAMPAAVVAHDGWPGLAARIELRCFASEPGLAPSLKMPRRMPLARAKVESPYLVLQRGGGSGQAR